MKKKKAAEGKTVAGPTYPAVILTALDAMTSEMTGAPLREDDDE